MSRKEKTIALIILFILSTFAARFSHLLILSDYPITDDEYATKFGGQVLAMGKIMVTKPEPYEAFPQLFLYERNGKVTSFDWIGPQTAWAISEVTHSGPLVFALAAALPAICLAIILGMGLSAGYGLTAALLFLFSPMAFALSATTHAHLLSRAMIAATLLFFILARKKATFASWTLTGLALGSSFCCRPIETSFIMAPLFLDLLITEISREKRFTKAVWGIIAGAVLPLAIFFIHSWLLTGQYSFPARFTAENPSFGSLWTRFGANSSYNLFMLAIWFLGPLGILLTALGLSANRFTKLLGAGVAAMLAAGLVHENYGLHIVGPIHYSECAVPLTVLAVHGLANLRGWMSRREISFRAPACMLASALVLGLGTFIVWQCAALNRQAQIQKFIYGRVESAAARPAGGRSVVLAPQFRKVWENIPEFKATGGWVFQWRRARPDLSDRILIVHDVPGAEEALRKRFPERKFFRLRNLADPPYFEIAALDPSAP